jgi:hypothetical protein
VAEIELTSDTVIVHVKGADRILALKSELTIPLEHVLGARETKKGHAAGITAYGLLGPACPA